MLFLRKKRKLEHQSVLFLILDSYRIGATGSPSCWKFWRILGRSVCLFLFLCFFIRFSLKRECSSGDDIVYLLVGSFERAGPGWKWCLSGWYFFSFLLTDFFSFVITRRGHVTLTELSSITMIRVDDIVDTLQSMRLIKYYKGQHILSVSPKLLEDHRKSVEKNRLKVDMSKLHWRPLKLGDH